MKTINQKSSAQKKYALLNEGILAFMTQGYHGVGIKQLLDTCGIPKGSFYHYFDSKDDFLAQVIDYYTEMLFAIYDNVAEQTDLSAFEKIQRMTEVKQTMSAKFTSGCLWGAMTAEVINSIVPAREVMTRVFDKWMVYFTELFAAAQAAGEVTQDISAQDLSRLYWNQWQGGLLQSQLQSQSDLKSEKQAAQQRFYPFFQLIRTTAT